MYEWNHHYYQLFESIYFQWHSSEEEDIISDSDTNDSEDFNLEIYFSKKRKGHYHQKWTMRYLLMAEAMNVAPHKCNDFAYEHGSFEIPFQTELYREWVGNLNGYIV